MKRGLILVCIFLTLVLSFSFVYADCSADQTILKLSSASNAHGAVWDYNVPGLYNTKICYSDIWGHPYAVVTGENPHSCSTNNRVLSLSSETNAHGSTSHDSTYNIDVCYGDLTCEVKLGGAACSSGFNFVASLSSALGNAHLSNSADYTNRICCKSGVQAQLNDAKWKNMNNQEISAADKGDSVKLTVKGIGLQEVNYTIKKGVAFWFDRKVGTLSSTSGELIWQAGKDKNGNLETGTYYFIANLADGTSKTSGHLGVVEGPNDPIEVTIFKPIDKQIYFLNELLNFSMLANDSDDAIYYSWNLGDGTVKVGNGLTKGNSAFEHAYSSAGQKNIFLNVWNSRGQNITKRVAILVINSSYILAYIDKPEFQGDYFDKIIKFNAISSYAVDYNHETGTITCLMGNCPSQSEGCPTPTGCHINVTGTPKGYDNANFTWIFDNSPIANITGNGTIAFTRKFSAGTHYISLFVELASVGVINTEFNVFYDVPTCDSIDGMWYMPDGNIIDSSDNCYLEEANGGCCPEDFTCEQETGICVPRKIYSCSNYTTETACIGYDSEVANYDINTKENWFNGNFCGGDVFEYDDNGCEKTADNCRCDWNVSEGKCYSQYDLQRSCNGEEPITLGECTFQSTQETDCSLGYRHIEWEALWDPGTLEEVENLECNSGSEDVPCLSETLLGFFDNIGLIIAVLLLILAYWIIVHNKKHHSVRKKKR